MASIYAKAPNRKLIRCRASLRPDERVGLEPPMAFSFAANSPIALCVRGDALKETGFCRNSWIGTNTHAFYMRMQTIENLNRGGCSYGSI
jgi:hypothetical protein